MDRFRFLHAADLHLDSPLRGLERYEGAPVDELRNATRRAFENLVACALDECVEFVVLAGDVFDGEWRDFGTGLFFAQQLRRLADAGIRTYLLTGNHDAASVVTRHLNLPERVFRFDTVRPESIVDAPTGAVLHGQGFATRAVEQDLAAGYPEPHRGAFNIGVLHTALDGREGHDPYAPCSVATLRAKGYAYWALGHVHAREVVATEPWIVFPGNLQGRHVRETGAKGASLVTVEGLQITAVEHRELDVVRFAHLVVDVADANGLGGVIDRVERAIARAVDPLGDRLLAARVELVGRTVVDGVLRQRRDDTIAECRNAANAHGRVWIEDLRIATQPSDARRGRDLLDALGLDDVGLRSAALDALRGELDALRGDLRSAGAADADPVLDDERVAALFDAAQAELLHRLWAARADHDEGGA